MTPTGKAQLRDENEMQQLRNTDLPSGVCIAWGGVGLEQPSLKFFGAFVESLKRFSVFSSLCCISESKAQV